MVESDLGTTLALVAVPDDELVTLLCEDQHYDVRGIVHLNQ